MINTPQTATVSDEAVQAFKQEFHENSPKRDYDENIKSSLTAALPHLALSSAPCSVEVKKLTWRDVDAYCAWCYADTDFGQYRVTWSFNEIGQKLHFPNGTTKQFDEKGYGDRDAAKAAAQADFDRRILSAIVTKPVDVAAGLESNLVTSAKAAQKVISAIFMSGGLDVHSWWGDLIAAQCGLASSLRALSPAEPAQGERLPQDVIDLVIAGRELVYSDEIRTGSELSTALDKALECFASRVPWENEPDDVDTSINETQTIEEKRNLAAFKLVEAIREMTEGEWEPDFGQSFELLDVISTAEPAQADQLPQDVIDLVIAGREFVYGSECSPLSEEYNALDKTLEAFSSRIPWDDEPTSTTEGGEA